MTKWIVMMALAAVVAGAPGPAYQPTQSERRQIQAKIAELGLNLNALAKSGADADLLADVAIYRKAAEWIMRYEDEFFSKAYLANTAAALETGLGRAKELSAGQPSWPRRKGRLTRAYRSRVDGSLQPYGLLIPESYDGSKPGRLDVVLHGRGATLNEVSFIAAHDAAKAVPPEIDYIQLEVFGRGNNAYRWAGETDVFETLESVQKRYKIDPDRIVLRGFSMGGAGAWHIGLQHPSRWAAFEAGAGFTETKIYAKRDLMPAYQESLLHIYDARDYALNAFDVPTVGYGGEDDPQKQASINIREQLTKEGFSFTPEGLNWTTKDLRALFLIGPHTQHKFHPDSKAISDKFLDQTVVDGRHAPDHIRFVTYTTRFNHCFWVTVEGLGRHYERADVDARLDGGRLAVSTNNVSRISFTLPRTPQSITIDGQTMGFQLSLDRTSGKWAASGGSGLRKFHGLQGPIDDAFMDSFLCVRPTGWPSPGTAYASKKLERFANEYAKYLRGDVRIKDDRAVTPEDIADSNLILFGDPASNAVIRRIAAKLPLRWTKENITLGKLQFSASQNIPVLIYPNPLNPKKYVVINSGHTFHQADFDGTNALLYPRLGDWAIEKLDGTVIEGGLFDESWK
ncbi:MAG: prolyl oligopeptidase family serine peptidase [Acidobacteriota bacterium]|nr:prolyl oligopeptidase family serine peptidase [Acidobacteriota bacterium]